MGKLCRLASEFKGSAVRTDFVVPLQSTSDDKHVGALEGSVCYTAQRSIVAQAGKVGGSSSGISVSLHIVRATGLLDAFYNSELLQGSAATATASSSSSSPPSKPPIEEHELNILLRAAVLSASRTPSDRTEWVEAPALYACSAYPDIDCTLTLPGAGDFVAVEVWHRPNERVSWR